MIRDYLIYYTFEESLLVFRRFLEKFSEGRFKNCTSRYKNLGAGSKYFEPALRSRCQFNIF